MFLFSVKRVCIVESKLKCFACIPLLCTSRYKHENHYEVLKVPKDCTDKEIRDSFVKLSKECHPDMSKVTSAASTQRFTQIMEAYKILSRPDSRAAYDYNLNRIYQEIDPRMAKRNEYYEFYRQTGEARPQNTDSYYGIKGVNKVANWKIVLFLMGFALAGVALQMFAIIKSVTFRRDDLDKQSLKAGSLYTSVRADAEKYGTTEQLQRIQDRMQTMYVAGKKD